MKEPQTLETIMQAAVSPHMKAGVTAAKADMDEVCKQIIFGLGNGLPGVLFSPKAFGELKPLAQRFYVSEVKSWLPQIAQLDFVVRVAEPRGTIGVSW